MNPPRKVIEQSLRRMQSSHEALQYGEIEIAGTVYRAAVDVGAEEWELAESGPRLVQRLKATVDKCVLDTAPKQGDKVKVGTNVFRVTMIAGFNEMDQSWEIDGMRLIEKQ